MYHDIKKDLGRIVLLPLGIRSPITGSIYSLDLFDGSIEEVFKDKTVLGELVLDPLSVNKSTIPEYKVVDPLKQVMEISDIKLENIDSVDVITGSVTVKVDKIKNLLEVESLSDFKIRPGVRAVVKVEKSTESSHPDLRRIRELIAIDLYILQPGTVPKLISNLPEEIIEDDRNKLIEEENTWSKIVLSELSSTGSGESSGGLQQETEGQQDQQV